MASLGYARVSTVEQNADLEIAKLLGVSRATVYRYLTLLTNEDNE